MAKYSSEPSEMRTPNDGCLPIHSFAEEPKGTLIFEVTKLDASLLRAAIAGMAVQLVATQKTIEVHILSRRLGEVHNDSLAAVRRIIISNRVAAAMIECIAGRVVWVKLTTIT